MCDDNVPPTPLVLNPSVDTSKETVWRLRMMRAPAKDSIESNHGNAMAEDGVFPAPRKKPALMQRVTGRREVRKKGVRKRAGLTNRI
jgi:hypothetical protein